MYLNIKEAKLRLDAINQLRINRALSVMTPVYQRVYLMLPVFLHYQNPLFPGYLPDDGITANGIFNFQLNDLQKYYISDYEKKNNLTVALNPVSDCVITGVYTMGSTSSIGQNDDSDLDIWICHSPSLNEQCVAKLKQKCEMIEHWAAELGVDLSLFLINENRFRQHQSGCLGGEDCGSTQHIFLLDEFYRTSVKLAGKSILWNIVPVAEELKDYDAYARQLNASAGFSSDEWLDLGGLGSLSAEEYFGASLWQLYKSIDSPYKAVLKTLLLEAYSWEYPNTKLLALDMKERQQAGEFLNVNIDSYHLILERVSHYLTTIGDHARLDLARRCFYLKVCEKLSDTVKPINWRHEILNRLVVNWGWDFDKLAYLDNRENWKIEDVRKAHDELLEAMMQSYRNLIRFARRNNLSVSASPQDVGVLTRKLYAAFEALPGKITLVNPLISPDLSEADLTLVHVDNSRANLDGWYLYNHAPHFDDIVGHQPIEYHPYVSKLLAWSYFNGLLTPETKFHIHSRNPKDVIKINRAVSDIAEHFPLKVPASTPKELYSPCEIRQLAVMVNLENDPTAKMDTSQMTLNTRKLDMLSFGDEQECLVGSVDLVYRNSWNEVRTLHFNGEQSVLEALKTILGKMHQDARRPDKIDVFCYSQNFDELISKRVKQLVTQAVNLRLSSTKNEQGRFKAVKIAGQTWGIFFESLSVSVQKLENPIEFYGAISNNKLNEISMQFGSKRVVLPEVIYGVASEGIVQFFFEDAEDDFTIYILDELNRVEIYCHCDGSKDDYIREISSFYASSQDKFAYDPKFVNFNLPQFYKIVTVNNSRCVVPYISSETTYHSTTPSTLKEVGGDENND